MRTGFVGYITPVFDKNWYFDGFILLYIWFLIGRPAGRIAPIELNTVVAKRPVPNNNLPGTDKDKPPIIIGAIDPATSAALLAVLLNKFKKAGL